MKKKLMMVAVFLGALSLGACVDDNESASVTNVRNAKAEQLKAAAELDKAQAEAALIQANTEKLIAEAEAAYQAALTAAKELENEQAKLALQKAQATLDIEIEAAKIKAEAQLQAAKAALETAKANLIAALDKVDAAEKQRIQDLVVKADNVLQLLQDARGAKLSATTQIARLNAELVIVEEYVANETKRYEGYIARQEALIAEYSKYEATVKTKEEAKKAYDEAHATWLALDKISREKNVAYEEAQQVYFDKVDLQGQYEFAQKAGGEYWQYYKVVDIFDDGDNNPHNHSVEYTYEDKTVGIENFYVPVVNYELNTEAIAQAKENCAGELKNTEEGWLSYAENQVKVTALAVAEAQKALTDKQATDEYKNAVKAVADAQKAYDEAKTSEDKNNAYWTLQAKKQDLANVTINEENALNTANENKESADENLKNAKEHVENLNKELAKIDEAEAFATGDAAKAYTEYVDTYKKAFEALNIDAALAKENANRAVEKQWTLANSLNNIANSYADYEGLISNCKQNISRYQGFIAELDNVATKEEAIKQEQEKLAKAESDVAIYEAQYKDYMSQIQALIESTPAE
ncbi:hypothetical protein [Bacteroides sp.]|uniref:hypothetical protein n=1 Tax=Bacteroides sp. TaxID=29523 RepID=UPI0023D42148|nr:hypothetical protein [Bacteroides sp.]MDE6216891.1 hypothetical protein [Bacteroides sp.]